MTAALAAAGWGADVISMLADRRPRSVDQLAARTGVRHGELLAFLQDHPHLLETSEGWVHALRLADGVAFVHELSAAEREADSLAADDDLALWAVLAQQGLPLAGGGEVRAHPLPELPAGLRTNLLPGYGLIGQGLVGPSGWLAHFQAGDMLEVRLRDGALAVRAVEPPPYRPKLAVALLAACTAAIGQAMERYSKGNGEVPAADIPEVLADLLLTRPEVLADPLPPLRELPGFKIWETFSGRVGFRGTAWDLTWVKDLSRSDAMLATLALGMLLTWDGADPGSEETIGTLRRVLALPEIVGYLADEVERRTARAGTSFTDALDRLAAVVDTPAERAGAALLSARAAEGAGDSVTAQRLVERALAEQPNLQLALLDAAEYAACRGDLRIADHYLRRAAHPFAEALLSAVRSVLDAPAGRAQPGRNRPCPCGSGRKLKLCCNTAVTAPLATRAGLLYTLVATFAHRALSGNVLGHLINESGRDLPCAMFCVDLLLTHEGLAEQFLRARGAWLRDDERTLVEAWTRVPIGALEVREVRLGVGVTVRVLPDGPLVVLQDRKFSTCAQRLDLLCGRLLSDGSRPQLLAMPVLVPRDRRRDLLDLVASGPSAEQLAQFVGPQPKPFLRNSDGHDHMDAEVTLEVPDADTAWQRLCARLVRTAADTLEHHDERDGKIVKLGTVIRTRQQWNMEQRWELRANSRERLAALESRVRAEAPAAREVSRRVERVGGEPPRDGRKVHTLVVDTYVVTAGSDLDERGVHEQFSQITRESWVDAPNVIEGMTPREAVKAGGDARRELEALLDDMEWNNDRNAEQGNPPTMDVAWIRAELGVPG